MKSPEKFSENSLVKNNHPTSKRVRFKTSDRFKVNLSKIKLKEQ